MNQLYIYIYPHIPSLLLMSSSKSRWRSFAQNRNLTAPNT